MLRIRPEFREWVDSKPEPNWGLMPLTHIAKGLIAKDIIREGKIEPKDCPVFARPLAYFFYGRPAYRVAGDGAIRDAATCPFAFIFEPNTIERAQAIHAFDTGAFHNRMYNHVLMEEMQIDDFSLERESRRVNRLVYCVFRNLSNYYDGDTSKIPEPNQIAAKGDFLAQAYIKLLRAEGRNEADDRICTIEVTLGEPLSLDGNLMAIVVPDMLWNDSEKTNWIAEVEKGGVDILPYRFSIGRESGHYHALIEQEIRHYYTKRELI